MIATSETHDVAAFEPRAMVAWRLALCPHERRRPCTRARMRGQEVILCGEGVLSSFHVNSFAVDRTHVNGNTYFCE